MFWLSLVSDRQTNSLFVIRDEVLGLSGSWRSFLLLDKSPRFIAKSTDGYPWNYRVLASMPNGIKSRVELTIGFVSAEPF